VEKSKIALKPYLDTIAGYCGALSNQELTDILLCLARDVPTSGRVNFLEKIESYLPGRRPAVIAETDALEQILDGIEALKESIEERIRSIEDGSYWDDPDVWEDDGYDEEAPDYISEDQEEELGSFFDDAERLFLDDRLADARKVYEALFNLIRDIKGELYFSPTDEIDIREARARYCRCAYETAHRDKRLDEFIKAMEVDAPYPYHENKYNEDYPLMQEVIDAKPGEMEGLKSFLPAWKMALTKRGTKGRPAGLLLEAVHRLEGISGVSRLAKEWENNQPQGYLFWLDALKKENDQKGIIRVSGEGLKALKEGKPRERVAECMIDAAKELRDPHHILVGKRERLFSYISDQNLVDLVDEATVQDKRDNELDTVIRFFEGRKEIDQEKELYARALLMSGNLNSAFALAKNEKGVGWSYGNNAGVVFGAILSVLVDHSEKAGTIKTLLKNYANKRTVYSGKFLTDDGKGTSFYDEIIKGLTQNKETKSQAAEYLSWAQKIGKSRIEHIVSNKHRRAYERAAQVLGSLAEVYLVLGQKGKAVNILHTYYNEKYNRFSAFRKEVKAVVMGSDLLRNSGFLNQQFVK